MRNREQFLSAYMTLEISLLFPIIIMVLVCSIYLCFFSYDQTIAFQNAAISAQYGKGLSYFDLDNTVIIENTYNVLEELNTNQYISLEIIKQKVEVGKNTIRVAQGGNMKIPFLSKETFSRLILKEEVILDFQNSTFYIRQIRKVKGRWTK